MFTFSMGILNPLRVFLHSLVADTIAKPATRDIATRKTIDATRMAAPAATPKTRALLNAGLVVRTATGEQILFYVYRYTVMHILFRYLPSLSCFLNHKATPPSTAKMTSLCDKLKRCRNCNQMVQTSHAGQHICNQVFCRTCNCNVERGEHRCYIKVNFYSRFICIISSQLPFFSRLRRKMMKRDGKRKRAKKETHRFVFFDFETRQDEEVEPNQYE